MTDERFNSKINRECWAWTGAPTPDGYGVFYITSNHRVMAHRYAYEMTYGPIPAGMVIDHLCNVPICVRPDHLEAVADETNNQRKIDRRDSCKRGHPYSLHGARRKGNGRRYCKECHRLYTIALREGKDKGERLT